MYYPYLTPVINIAALSQRNDQRANNVSLFSAGAVQVASQNAGNNANVIQG